MNDTIISELAVRIQQRLINHEHWKESGQWYIDEFLVDCDIEPLCQLMAKIAFEEMHVKITQH